MLVPEVMLVRKGFKGSRGFAVISDPKVIQGVKAQKEISDLRDPQVRSGQSVLQVHREMSDFRDPEAFRGRPGQPGQPDQWARKV